LLTTSLANLLWAKLIEEAHRRQPSGKWLHRRVSSSCFHEKRTIFKFPSIQATFKEVFKILKSLSAKRGVESKKLKVLETYGF
jgi:hypothetical protein